MKGDTRDPALHADAATLQAEKGGYFTLESDSTQGLAFLAQKVAPFPPWCSGALQYTRIASASHLTWKLTSFERYEIICV